MGAPIFLSLGISGLLGLFLDRGPIALSFSSTSLFGQLNAFELIAIPLFILMGYVLAATPIGGQIFDVASKWLGRVRGGLAISSVGACTVFGAISGVSIAGVASIGALAVPQMIARGYSRHIAAGAVVTSGAIAMLIPPSVPFIIYSAVSGESVAKLFIGGFVPGLVMALALSLYIYLRVLVNPEEAPTRSEPVPMKQKVLSLGQIWHVALLVALVLGTIYSGLATPTEASAFGAAGAFLIAGLVHRVLDWKRLREILGGALRTSAAVMLIVGCAKIFGDYLNLIRLPQTLAEYVLALDVPSFVILFAIMVLLVLLGMIVDAVSMIVVTTPILLPLIVGLGNDPLWFGIIMVLSLEIAVVTPPVGLNLYTLKGVCPFLTIEEIIRASLPFVGIQIIIMMLFVFWPALSLWLPNLVYN